MHTKPQVSPFLMKLVLNVLVVSTLVSVNSQAQYATMLGYGPRFDSSPVGVGSERRMPLRLGAGYYINSRVILALDFGLYGFQSGVGPLSTNTQRYELFAWAKMSPWMQPSWLPYGMIGVGLMRTDITTKLGSQEVSDQGRLEVFPGIGVGVFNKIAGVFSVGTEAKLAYRWSTSPRVSAEIIGLVGVLL